MVSDKQCAQCAHREHGDGPCLQSNCRCPATFEDAPSWEEAYLPSPVHCPMSPEDGPKDRGCGALSMIISSDGTVNTWQCEKGHVWTERKVSL